MAPELQRADIVDRLRPLRQRQAAPLDIRVSAADKATLERVSRSMRMSTSEFVVREAVASAEEILAERTRFILPEEQWEAFVARLDEPPREIPALVRALGRPSPFDE